MLSLLSSLLFFIPLQLTVHQFEGKFLICFESVSNRSNGFEVDEGKFSAGFVRVCTATIERRDGEWRGPRLGSAISLRNGSLSTCSSSLIILSCVSHNCNRQWNSVSSLLSACQNRNSSAASTRNLFLPHYERSIECFNSTLKRMERIVNLDPRKAEVCVSQSHFDKRWTFRAGPITIWRSQLSKMNVCEASFLRFACLKPQCTHSLLSTSQLIRRCAHYAHANSSVLSCFDCGGSIDASLPFSSLPPPLIRPPPSIAAPSIRFSVEENPRKPALQTTSERVATTTRRYPIVQKQTKGGTDRKSENLEEGYRHAPSSSPPSSVESIQPAFHPSDPSIPLDLSDGSRPSVRSSIKSTFAPTRYPNYTELSVAQYHLRAKSAGSTGSMSARIRVVETRPEHSRLGGDEGDGTEGSSLESIEENPRRLSIQPISDRVTTTTRKYPIIPTSLPSPSFHVRPEEHQRISAVMTRLSNEREKGGEGKEEGKIEERKEEAGIRKVAIEKASIRLSASLSQSPSTRSLHNSTLSSHDQFHPSEVLVHLKILRMGLLAAFVSISIIILLFIFLIILMRRRPNSTSSREDLLPPHSPKTN
ncbi:hypothetical protein PMAYCL1PPCAC_26841, partial [Pristionchus mayeri]